MNEEEKETILILIKSTSGEEARIMLKYDDNDGNSIAEGKARVKGDTMTKSIFQMLMSVFDASNDTETTLNKIVNVLSEENSHE